MSSYPATIPQGSQRQRMWKPTPHSAGWKWTHQDWAVVTKVRDHLRAQQRWRRECAAIVVRKDPRRG